MKNRLFSIATLLVAFAATPKAQAEVGGPFDNGDFSVLMERSGVYQATFSFSNGSGMCMFAQDNSFEPATATTVAGQFALHNRSVFYYKGITYAGTATGIVDAAAKRITGFTNGSSDYAAAAGAISTALGGNSGGRNQIVSNGQIGFVANSQFNAKITADHPILRFRGRGTVAFMGFPQLGALSAIANAINVANATNAIFNATTPPGPIVPPLISVPSVLITPAEASSLVQNAQNLLAQVDNPSATEAFQEVQKMKVYGSRRFF